MSAAYIEMHSKLLFIIDAKTMNPDQTAPKGILFAMLASELHKQIREQTAKA